MRARIPARPALGLHLRSSWPPLLWARATSGLFAAGPAAAQTYTPLPAHVYAPYYETYLAPNTAEPARHRPVVRG